MNKFIQRLQKVELNSNQLKIIGIITMIIDHIGYYFESSMPYAIYIALRAVGRISMPIFAFLLVQGFFHTSDVKKYILRIFGLAVVTQLAIYAVSLFDKNSYELKINRELNIVFSYTLSLITLWTIHEKKLIQKFDNNKNMLLKILLIVVILGTFLFIPFDYEIYAPLLIVMFYFIEKVKIMIYLNKQSYKMDIKNLFISSVPEEKIRTIYTASIFVALFTVVIRSATPIYWYMLLSIIPIALYNGQRGKKSKKINYMFYLSFPLQHFLIYFLSLI